MELGTADHVGVTLEKTGRENAVPAVKQLPSSARDNETKTGRYLHSDLKLVADSSSLNVESTMALDNGATISSRKAATSVSVIGDEADAACTCD